MKVDQIILPGFDLFKKRPFALPIPFGLRDGNALFQAGSQFFRHIRRPGIGSSKTDSIMSGKVPNQPLNDLSHASQIKHRLGGNLEHPELAHSGCILESHWLRFYFVLPQ